jgi:hypothetical protein
MDALGDHRAIRLQKPSARVGHEVKESRLEPEVADLIADEEVDPLRQLDLDGLRVDEAQAIREPVARGNRARELDHPARLYRVHQPGARLTRKQSEYAAPTADVRDDGARDDDLADRAAKGIDPRAIDQVRPMFVDD